MTSSSDDTPLTGFDVLHIAASPRVGHNNWVAQAVSQIFVESNKELAW